MWGTSFDSRAPAPAKSKRVHEEAGHGAEQGVRVLLQVAAWKALERADLVVSDRLVSKEILDLVKVPPPRNGHAPSFAVPADFPTAPVDLRGWCVLGMLNALGGV